MKRTILYIPLVVVATLAGCGDAQRGPTLAGGREVSSWVADLNHPAAKVRRQAVLKLGNVGDVDPAAAEGLALALRDADPLVRRDAVHAVVKLTRPTDIMVARLQEMVRADRDTTVRGFAKKALTKLGQAE